MQELVAIKTRSPMEQITEDEVGLFSTQDRVSAYVLAIYPTIQPPLR
jgi:hypothetical protein